MCYILATVGTHQHMASTPCLHHRQPGQKSWARRKLEERQKLIFTIHPQASDIRNRAVKQPVILEFVPHMLLLHLPRRQTLEPASVCRHGRGRCRKEILMICHFDLSQLWPAVAVMTVCPDKWCRTANLQNKWLDIGNPTCGRGFN